MPVRDMLVKFLWQCFNDDVWVRDLFPIEFNVWDLSDRGMEMNSVHIVIQDFVES